MLLNPTIKRLVRAITPPVILASFGGRRAQNDGTKFSGPYRSWHEAASNSTGYCSEEVFDKVTASALRVKRGEAAYEIDSLVFDRIHYSWPVLAALLWVIAREDGRLHVCDLGGSLGTSYFQNRKFLSDFSNVRWNIVEQLGFVARGKALIEDERLRFYPTVEACLDECPCDVALLSGVLQYLEAPYEALDEIIARQFRYIIVDRTPFISAGVDLIAVQHVPPEIYHASCPAWFFSERKFVLMLEKNYQLVEQFDNFASYEVAELQAKMKGFIFRCSRMPVCHVD
ncbi:MAG TPA: methyltransferase, TIGR04325 family [Xanthobacteraceae bacterium]|jgi:putative methyltransferase (TIGR04325 family)|nr:methyltransferase, TIGR04325 family [Xanthobacteraceae bacterium]